MKRKIDPDRTAGILANVTLVAIVTGLVLVIMWASIFIKAALK